MADCIYTINGRKMNEQELMDYVSRYGDAFSALQYNSKAKVKFSAEFNPVNNTINTLERMHAKVKGVATDTNHYILADGNKAMRTSNFIQAIGWSIPFDFEAYKTNVIRRKREELGAKPSEEFIKEVEGLQEGLWKDFTEIGTASHRVLEELFNEDTVGTVEAITEAVKDEEGILNRVDLTPKLLDQFKDIVNTIKKDEEVVQYITETRLWTDNITSEAAKIAGTSTIAGTADLIAVRKDGSVDIYDYKTSLKDYDDWSRQKRKKILYQQYIYKLMLENQGIRVNSMSIIPIELDIADGKATNVKGASIASVQDGKFKDFKDVRLNVTKTVLSEHDVNIDLIANDKELIETMSNVLNYDINYELMARNTVDNLLAKGKFLKEDDKGQFFTTFDKDKKEYVKNYVTEENKEEKITEYLKAQQKADVNMSKAIYSRFQSEMLHGSAGYVTDSVSKVINKYITEPGWTALQDARMEALNLVAFVNGITKSVDIVSGLNSKADMKIDLAQGNTLLGNYLPNHKVKKNRIMSSTKANIELMKNTLFYYANPKMFNGLKLSGITVANEEGNPIIQTLDVILPQLDMLVKAAGDDVTIPNLKIDFSKKVNPVVELNNYLSHIGTTLIAENPRNWQAKKAKELSDSLSALLGDDENIIEERIEEHKKEVIHNLSIHYNMLLRDAKGRLEEYPESQKEIKEAIRKIGNTLSMLNNVINAVELDLIPTTKNVGTLNKIGTKLFNGLKKKIDMILYDIGQAYSEYGSQLNGELRKFYDDQGTATTQRITGDVYGSFSNLFEIVNGKKTMRFKNPKTDETLTQSEKDMIEYFGELGLRARAGVMPNKEPTAGQLSAMEGWRKSELHLNIPLMPASIMSRFKNKNTSDVFKDLLRDHYNLEALFEDDVDYKESLQTRTTISDFFAFTEKGQVRENKIIDADDRASEFEQNIEAVYHFYVMSKMRRAHLVKEMPSVNAIRNQMVSNQANLHAKIPETISLADNVIDNALFRKTDVDIREKKVEKAVAAASMFTSMANMSINFMGGTTEYLNGLWVSTSMVLSNQFHKGAFGFKEFAFAFKEVTFGSMDIDRISMIDQLNYTYKVSGMDLNVITTKMRTDYGGTAAFMSKWLYWWNAMPDFQNRMRFLIAQMKKDGTYEAHSIDESDPYRAEMIYDPTKDLRFAAYFKGDDGSKEYKESKARYLNLVNLLANETNGLNDDGTPRRAYVAKEILSLKQVADDSFGAYDYHDRVFLRNTAWGRLILQFKTWLLAKRDRWYMHTKPSDISNIGKFTPVVVESVDADGNKTEETVMQWEGRMMEGILQTLLYIKDELNTADKGVLDIANIIGGLEDERKENLTRMISDLLLAMTLGGIGMAAKDATSQEQGSFGWAASKVFYNSARDMFILNNMGAFISEGSQSATIGYFSGMMSSVWGSILGEKDPWLEFLRTFSITRPYYYYARDNQ